MKDEKIRLIAEVAHEANAGFCESIGDSSQVKWQDAPQWQKDSAIEGVKFHIANPDATPQNSHESWSEQKIDDGWIYGETKDAEAKTHPCLVDYTDLPKEQQSKDFIYSSIVKTMIKRTF